MCDVKGQDQLTLNKNRLVAPIVTVFGKKHYVLLALATTILFWIILNVLDQLLFFWPIITFYLPESKIAGFILSNLTAGIMGILTSMNVYALKNAHAFRRSSVIPGSALGIASCACAGCSSLGFFLVSTLGTAGAAGVAFFAVYQMPLRILSFAVLAWAYYSVQRGIITSSIQKYKRSSSEDGA